MTVSSSQITVGTSRVNVVSFAQAGGVRNAGASPIYIGDATVTTSSGFELDAHESVLLDGNEGFSLWAVAATPNQRLDVLQRSFPSAVRFTAPTITRLQASLQGKTWTIGFPYTAQSQEELNLLKTLTSAYQIGGPGDRQPVALTANRVNVGTSAVEIVTPDPDGQSAVLRNRGTGAIYLGDATVTTATGFQVDSGDIVTIDLAAGETLWAVAASTQAVHLLLSGVG